MVEPYLSRDRRAMRRPSLASLVVFLMALAAVPLYAAPARQLEADGHWHKFEIRVPEQTLAYLFEVTAGCRYRMTVQCRGLPRALLELGPPDSALYEADSRPPDDLPGDEPPSPPPEHPEAVVTWYAQVEGVWEASVRGFSAMTGRGRIRLETLGPEGERVKAHRRLLAPGVTLAQVGSLWVGKADRWELVVEPGRTYQVTSQPGTAGRISLAVLGPKKEVLAEAQPSPDAPYPRLRFVVPDAPPGEKAKRLTLEARALDGGGGTYGVRLEADPPRPSTVDEPPELPSPVETGLVEGQHPLMFRANPGDVAILYLPRSNPFNAHWIQRESGSKWMRLPHDGVSAHGERASMRTPEKAALVWFRPFVPGTYRFAERKAKDAILRVYAAEDVPEAPLLIGTGLDPTISARGTSDWQTIGVGVCMPGWSYLFVAVGRRRAAVSMRIRYAPAPEAALVTRRGLGGTRVAGLGPSLRFRVKTPTLVHLQVRGKLWVGYALLRRAGN